MKRINSCVIEFFDLNEAKQFCANNINWVLIRHETCINVYYDPYHLLKK